MFDLQVHRKTFHSPNIISNVLRKRITMHPLQRVTQISVTLISQKCDSDRFWFKIKRSKMSLLSRNSALKKVALDNSKKNITSTIQTDGMFDLQVHRKIHLLSKHHFECASQAHNNALAATRVIQISGTLINSQKCDSQRQILVQNQKKQSESACFREILHCQKKWHWIIQKKKESGTSNWNWASKEPE